jgi:hypothetical protein
LLAQFCNRGRTISSLTLTLRLGGPSSSSASGVLLNNERQFEIQYKGATSALSPLLRAIVGAPDVIVWDLASAVPIRAATARLTVTMNVFDKTSITCPQ